MSLRARVFSNTVSQMVGRIVGAATTFLVSYLLAREFGAVGFGEFTKVVTFIAPFFLIVDFGINAIFIKHHEETSLFPALLGLRLIGSLLGIFVALSLLAFLPQGVNQGYTALVRFGIILYSPAILFQALITTSNAVFQKNLRYDLATYGIVAGSLVTVLILLFVTTVFTPTIGIVMSLVALTGGSVVTAGLSLFFVRRQNVSFGISFSKNHMKQLLLPAIPLGITLLFNLIYFHIDTFILTLTRTTAEVGVYGLAYKFFEFPLVFPTFFMNAVYPFMVQSQVSESRYLNLWRITKKSLIILLGISLLFVIGFWIAAPLLTLIREDFSASIEPFRILILGLPLFFVSSVFMWVLVTVGKQRLLLVLYGGSMIVNAVLNYLFIPRFSYLAAAWITLVSEALVVVASGFAVWQLFKGRQQESA